VIDSSYSLLGYAFQSLGPALSVLSLMVLLVFTALLLLLAAYLAALPGRIAHSRGHPNAEAVSVCGWLGLLTGFGWIVAMVWAFATPDAGSPNLTARLDALDEAVGALEAAVTGGTR
jgi:hypothetical protein